MRNTPSKRISLAKLKIDDISDIACCGPSTNVRPFLTYCYLYSTQNSGIKHTCTYRKKHNRLVNKNSEKYKRHVFLRVVIYFYSSAHR